MTEQTTLFRYHGRSMWPCFQEGDLLEILPVAIDSIHSGDCVAFRVDNGQTAAHRVVSMQGSLTTRGDALPVVDREAIQSEHLLGKVVSIYRLGRSIKVRGGLVGRVSGFLYHYAGRIDPNRSSRGGKLARVIRASSTLVFRMLNCACVARTLKLTGGDKITVWELQGRVIGRQDSRKSENFLAWPWSVFVELPKKAI